MQSESPILLKTNSPNGYWKTVIFHHSWYWLAASKLKGEWTWNFLFVPSKSSWSSNDRARCCRYRQGCSLQCILHHFLFRTANMGSTILTKPIFLLKTMRSFGLMIAIHAWMSDNATFKSWIFKKTNNNNRQIKLFWSVYYLNSHSL